MIVVVSLALLAASARADETVVALTSSAFVAETLDGTTLETVSVCQRGGSCLLPWHFGTPAHDGTIVFRDGRDGRPADVQGIWLVSPAGEVRHLTTGLFDDDPAIAPDGSLVAFDRYDPADGHADIYTVRPDGSGLRLVAGGPSQNRYPAFSPDGSTIAYWCGVAQPIVGRPLLGKWCGPSAGGSFAQAGLMRIGQDGSEKRLIVKNLGRDPTWAPDGSRLALAESGRIYVVRSDGRDLDGTQPLPNESVSFGFEPSFSSDGGSILFGSTTWQGVKGNFSLLMNSDGSGLRRLALQGHIPARFVPPATGGAVPSPVDIEHVVVPEVRTMSVGDARRELQSRGCGVGSITRRYSRSIHANHVITQHPTAGVRIRKKAKVSLVVSRGPPR